MRHRTAVHLLEIGEVVQRVKVIRPAELRGMVGVDVHRRPGPFPALKPRTGSPGSGASFSRSSATWMPGWDCLKTRPSADPFEHLRFPPKFQKWSLTVSSFGAAGDAEQGSRAARTSTVIAWSCDPGLMTRILPLLAWHASRAMRRTRRNSPGGSPAARRRRSTGCGPVAPDGFEPCARGARGHRRRRPFPEQPEAQVPFRADRPGRCCRRDSARSLSPSGGGAMVSMTSAPSVLKTPSRIRRRVDPQLWYQKSPPRSCVHAANLRMYGRSMTAKSRGDVISSP